MSMPSFPENGANMTREQALTMVIASVAMEERALSRILHAEGEKLRYILDHYQSAPGYRETPRAILDANKSVTRLLEAVAQNQMVLRDKLALAIEGGGKYPPEPPCPPPQPEPPEPPCPPHPPCAPACPVSPPVCPLRQDELDTLER